MANPYLMRSKGDNLNTLITKKLSANYTKHYENVAIYCPVIYVYRIVAVQEWLEKFNIKQSSKESYGFTLYDAMNIFSHDPHYFFSKILEEYENLKAKYDFALVTSFSEFGILDGSELGAKLAKNLNTSVTAIIGQKNQNITREAFNESLRGENYALIDTNPDFNELMNLKEYEFVTPNRFRFELTKKNVKNEKIAVLPENDDEGILRAGETLLRSNVVHLILLGNKTKIKESALKLGLDLNDIEVPDPANSPLCKEFSAILYEVRKARGMSLEEAAKLIEDRTYFGTLLMHSQKADAMVSGVSTTTAETVCPALQIIKTKEGINSASGIFFMGLKDKVLASADCVANPNPIAEQPVQSAYVNALNTKTFRLEPHIAVLSYSSGDSGKGESVDLASETLKIAKEKYPDLQIDEPTQFDCACDNKTTAKRMPNSTIAGKANVYVFPNLDTANIYYEVVQKTANALAIGPILQGLKEPANDLSRGCLAEGIVDAVILSTI